MALETPLPPTCSIGLKEWAGICEALAEGRQCALFRKGGIEDGPEGFRPEHSVFWLYPTHLHESQQGLREHQEPPASRAGDERPGALALRELAVVDRLVRVEDLEALHALEDLHIWTEDSVNRRFEYRRPGLWVLGVRVFRASEPRWIQVTEDHAGCKSWVPLAEELTTERLTPALDDEAFQSAMGRLDEIAP